MSCTEPKYAVQWLDNGKPYPHKHRFCALDFYNFRESMIIRSKYNGDLSAYLSDGHLKSGLCEGVDFRPVIVPCGKCTSCKMTYARNWSYRGLMESFFHEKAVFLTFTIDDDHLKEHGYSVDIKYLQKFFKRLRKHCKFRYLACGEYGTLNGRPHYHAILFGYYPDDCALYPVYQNCTATNVTEDKLYYSPFLNSIWKLGYVGVGNVTSQSIAYTCGYAFKKADSKFYKDHNLKPPFVTMSRKPGIGYKFLESFPDDCASDEIRIGEKVFQCPRYFIKMFEKFCPDLADHIKQKRCQASKDSFDNNYSTNRLKVLSELADLRFKKLQRYL